MARRLERAEQENAEIDGDEDEDEEGISFGISNDQNVVKDSEDDDDDAGVE